MRKIVYFPNEVLRRKSIEVSQLNEEVSRDLKDLVEVLLKSQNGAGLAAVQIGINKRFFGIRKSKEKDNQAVKIIINPKILGVYGEVDWIKQKVESSLSEAPKSEDFLEGCLSFPNLFGTVKRYLKLKAQWQEIEDNRLVRKDGIWSGFEALVFQHELDHLDGIVFIDHIKKDGGKLYRQNGEKMEELDWQSEKGGNFENLIAKEISR